MDDEQRLMMYMMMCQWMVMCVCICVDVCGYVTDSVTDTVVQYGDEYRSVGCRGCVTLSLYCNCTVLYCTENKQCAYTVWNLCYDDDTMSSVQYMHVWWCHYVLIGMYEGWLVCVLHLEWCKCVASCQTKFSNASVIRVSAVLSSRAYQWGCLWWIGSLTCANVLTSFNDGVDPLKHDW